MAISIDDLQMIEKLVQRIHKQTKEDKENENYYRGLQDIGNLGVSVPSDVEPFAFPLNWCRTYTDILCERQDVRLIMRAGDAREDAELRADWDANNMALELPKFNRDKIVLGRAALSVAADPDGGRPRIRVESPKHLAVDTDFVTGTTNAAARLYADKTGMAEAVALYRPDYTVLIRKNINRWEEVQRIEHGLGRVPVVVQYNRQTSDSRDTGESLLTDLKQLVNMAGRVMLQLQLAMETVGTPQKIAMGLKQSDFIDENGKPTSAWDAYLGSIWALADKDAKVTQLPGADLTGFHETIKMLAEQASTVTGLPVRMMGQHTANPPAEGAIRADEARLVKQVERLNAETGVALAWALGIGERIRTREWNSDGKIQIAWHNPATPTEAQRADYIQKLSGGKAVMSTRGAMNEMGWSQARIDKEMEWLSEEEGPWAVEDTLSRDPAPGGFE